ncbi:MAG: hypothetical protein LBO63_03120 [Oscillospiraceae bacterium]|jgi:hypothetical protein|nr:hypothetical protein [Oscillospiraceae bacterium]
MSEITKNSENFVGYEYKEVTTTRDMEGVYADGYPNFGWKLDNISPSAISLSTVSLRFKRDRKIRNKAELSRLQRQFDSGITQIESLERSKSTSAFAAALTVGLIGTAFMAGSVFAIVPTETPSVLLCAILAVPAFIGWALPYFIYKKMLAKKSATVAPLIEKQYDDIYEVSEKAHAISEN